MFRAVIVAQLAERLLPTSEIRGSNPNIGIVFRKYLCISVNCNSESTKIKKMGPGFARFLKTLFSWFSFFSTFCVLQETVTFSNFFSRLFCTPLSLIFINEIGFLTLSLYLIHTRTQTTSFSSAFLPDVNALNCLWISFLLFQTCHKLWNYVFLFFFGFPRRRKKTFGAFELNNQIL